MTATPSPADGIVNILDALGTITTPWTVVVGRMNDSADSMVCVRNTGGLPPEVAVAIDYPSIQVMVRGLAGAGSYSAAWAMASLIKAALLNIPNGGANYPELTVCKGKGDIMDIGYDSKERFTCVVNFDLIVCYSTSGYRTF